MAARNHAPQVYISAEHLTDLLYVPVVDHTGLNAAAIPHMRLHACV